MTRCLKCCEVINDKEFAKLQFHKLCSREFFGKSIPPVLDYSQNQLQEMAKKLVLSRKTITGVQPKLSLTSNKILTNSSLEKLTLVGLWGEYILKPKTDNYPELPQIEQVTMQLANFSKIKTVPFSLIRMKSGELAYLTKRVDRFKKQKFHMEDMCQLTERLTEHKYKGSHEQIAKTIKKYSDNPGLDLVNFYELILFCFLTGNNDMHLKNFSLLKLPHLGYNLCPAYDLVASELIVEGDDEELALTLNGKKKKLKKQDFITAMNNAGINDKVIDNLFKKYKHLTPFWYKIIDSSFLSDKMKSDYKIMVVKKLSQLGI